MQQQNPTAGAEVRLERLCKSYGDFTAVDNVSITIEPGEFFTILGPSGSGKTTTMMMVAGFVYPTSGDIGIGGRPVASLPPQHRGLGMVFQNYAIFPHLTVFENVAFPLRVRKTPAADIKRLVGDMLDLVHLSGYADRLPRQLSGGQQQRVALARALVFRPSVLLMDEPLGALDRKLREHMQTEIRRIHKTLNVTVIYVTHDQDEAMTMSDRVAVMNRGRMEQVGAPIDLYERPNTRFVADFLGEQNFIKGTVTDVADATVRVRTGQGWEFSGVAATPLSIGQTVVASVRPEKISVDQGGSGNSWKGHVRETNYCGDVTRYRVEGDGIELMVKAQNRLAMPSHTDGKLIELSWSAQETRVFPE